jgi:sulfate adenylyltransferase (ADP) / ATP adenylyltransferase
LRKPKGAADKADGDKKYDPFDAPSGDLLVSYVPKENPSHVLVLNRFPIIANHFIVATRQFKEQAANLEADDLDVTYSCLKAWQDGADGERRKLFAFFNSGPQSGASQPHRHIQFLPEEDVRTGDESAGWHLLLESLGNATDTRPTEVPFTYFWAPIPSNPSPDLLHRLYLSLLEDTRSAWTRYSGRLGLSELQFSYNWAMLLSGMAMCPRLREGVVLTRDGGTEIGFVGINGTVLGGTLMVKRKDEWDFLRDSKEALNDVLQGIGVPSTSQMESNI